MFQLQYPAMALIAIFIIAYAAIALEHPLKINKSGSALVGAGLEKIRFFWYVKKISGLAFVGYLAGAGTYLVQYQLLH